MIKYKCRYMYDEWNCIVECVEKKTEYTILEFYGQYFNIKMHLGSIDNEFWCFFPEYNNMFTELLSPIDFYNNIDILLWKLNTASTFFVTEISGKISCPSGLILAERFLLYRNITE